VTSRWLNDAAMLARLTKDFRWFYRTPIRGTHAMAIVMHQLATRHERFLTAVEQLIFRNPSSPYLRLLDNAGCELGDIARLVETDGLEATLQALCAAGVYVTLDEFKGRQEAVRGNRRFAFADSDFDNPHVTSHIETRTGGSRGPATVLKLDFAFIADRALATALAYETHGLEGYDGAVWQIAGLRPVLQYAKAGKPPVAWFYPVEPLPPSTHAIARYLAALGKAFGHSLPTPVFLDLQDPERMARWLAAHTRDLRPVCLSTYASSAVRVCAAAKQAGIDLHGVAFIVIGEPFTEARRKVVEDAGARAIVGYGFNEAGTVGFGCTEPRASDDVHVFSNIYGLIQQSRSVADDGVSVDALLVTSLLTSGPKVLLNVESGDYGVVERRSCGCLLGQLGLTTHLSHIRSFEKLTTEGMTFVNTDLLRILEDVLPARFGGSSADYQLVEEAHDGALSRLVLIVSPKVGAVDEATVRQAFLDELSRDGWAERLMAGVWAKAGSVLVRRQQPIATKAGKILPFHVATASLG
jgi:hypothetical protein